MNWEVQCSGYSYSYPYSYHWESGLWCQTPLLHFCHLPGVGNEVVTDLTGLCDSGKCVDSGEERRGVQSIDEVMFRSINLRYVNIKVTKNDTVFVWLL